MGCLSVLGCCFNLPRDNNVFIGTWSRSLEFWSASYLDRQCYRLRDTIYQSWMDRVCIMTYLLFRARHVLIRLIPSYTCLG